MAVFILSKNIFHILIERTDAVSERCKTMVEKGMRIRQTGNNNVKPVTKEDIQIIREVPGIVHCILDQHGNDYIFPGDNDPQNCIVKHPGKLTFYTKDGKNCLSVITEYGAVAIPGEITKEENNFITFKSDKCKVILEEDERMIESAILAEWNFIGTIKEQQRRDEFRAVLAQAIQEELRARGLNVPPENIFFHEDGDDNPPHPPFDMGDDFDTNGMFE